MAILRSIQENFSSEISFPTNYSFIAFFSFLFLSDNIFTGSPFSPSIFVTNILIFQHILNKSVDLEHGRHTKILNICADVG